MLDLTTLKLTNGPWIIVCMNNPNPKEATFAVNAELSFATKTQCETYIRINHPEDYKDNLMFPVDAREMLKSEDMIGSLESMKEVDEFVKRLITKPTKMQ